MIKGRNLAIPTKLHLYLLQETGMSPMIEGLKLKNETHHVPVEKKGIKDS